MTLIFPSIPPHYLKTIGLPDYSPLTKEYLDGGEVRITRSVIGAGTSLMLSYNLLSHTDISTIMQFYAACKGEYTAFLLPSNVINHSQVIKDAIESLKSTTWWTFSGQPNISRQYATTVRGLYNADIKIVSVVS
jgi:hypothetical protein